MGDALLFDIYDGDHWSRECRDEHHARHQAALALTEMAREQIPGNGTVMALRINVRLREVSHFTPMLDFQTATGWTTQEV